jgi:hypothetical protein
MDRRTWLQMVGAVLAMGVRKPITPIEQVITPKDVSPEVIGRLKDAWWTYTPSSEVTWYRLPPMARGELDRDG